GYADIQFGYMGGEYHLRFLACDAQCRERFIGSFIPAGGPAYVLATVSTDVGIEMQPPGLRPAFGAEDFLQTTVQQTWHSSQPPATKFRQRGQIFPGL